jgi:hypothetical protein
VSPSLLLDNAKRPVGAGRCLLRFYVVCGRALSSALPECPIERGIADPIHGFTARPIELSAAPVRGEMRLGGASTRSGAAPSCGFFDAFAFGVYARLALLVGHDFTLPFLPFGRW